MQNTTVIITRLLNLHHQLQQSVTVSLTSHAKYNCDHYETVESPSSTATVSHSITDVTCKIQLWSLRDCWISIINCNSQPQCSWNHVQNTAANITRSSRKKKMFSLCVFTAVVALLSVKNGMCNIVYCDVRVVYASPCLSFLRQDNE